MARYNDEHARRALRNREYEVIRLVSSGLKNKEVANLLGTTECMIKNYLKAIFDKVGVWSRLELALWYIKKQEEEHG